MKKFLLALSALLLLAFQSANAQFSALSFGKYKITSIHATSFTSLDGTVALEVTNSFRRFTVQNISGIIYKGNTAFIIGTADDFQVPAGSNTVSITGHASLASTSALFALLSNPSIDPADYSFDVQAQIRTRRRVRTVEKKGIPLTRILKAN